MKKNVKKWWDFGTTLVVSLFFLILAISMTTGTMPLPSWMPAAQSAIAAKVIGWIFIVSIAANIVTSVINLFTK